MASFPDFQDSYYWQTVNDRLLKDTYDSDQAMYPAPELTYDRLKSWIDACPELCICLQRDQTESDSNQLKKSGNDDTHGIIITLPLFRSYWERLINEEIEEHHVDASEMFPPRSNTQSQAHGEIQQAQVGLHVFHIERYPGFSPTRHGTTFTAMALDEVRRRIRLGFLSWEVVGYSALTATKQGNAAFKRLGFTRPASASGSKLLHEGAEVVERKGNEAFNPSRPPPIAGDEIHRRRKEMASPDPCSLFHSEIS